MASIPVTIVGVMTYTGLEVGGGPMPGGPSGPPPWGIQLPPLGTWGGVAPPYPSHPIAPGGPSGPPPWGISLPPGGPGQPPLGIWGGGNVPMPTPPIYLPPGTIPDLKPEHPIYIPPAAPGVPAHPIVLPPPGSSEPPEVLEHWQAKTYWSPATGWG